MELRLLQQVELFHGLSEAELASIAAGAKLRSYPKNAVIITQGEESNTLYLVVEGKLKVYMSDDEGKEVILDFLREGDYFGELALLDAAPRMASVMALEPAHLGIVPGPHFLGCLRANPQIGINLMATLARRARSLANSVSSLALLDVYGRIAQLLLRESHETDGRRLTERLTHQEIANRVGASREMVGKVLKDLKIGGYIDVEDRCIVIKERLPARW
jgi:CRP/FNR family transcriptional regulator, cyclic AMP receptor protein